MTGRDSLYLKSAVLLFVALFARLLADQGSMPGNFQDLQAYHYPLRHLVTSTLQEGRLPLWNPYIFAGTPLAANPQAALFYPLSVLHRILPLPWSFSVEALLHLLLAATGMGLLLRKWRLDPAGAWLLAAAYALSPFLVARVAQGIPTLLAALAWVPWVWLAALAANPVWLGLTLTLQGLSGHPQFTLISFVGLALFTLLRRPSRLIAMAQAGSLALFLASIQFWPTIEFLRRSVRSIWDPRLAAGYAYELRHLLTFLCPDALGTPLNPGFPYPSEYFEMMTGYVGLAPLALALAGLASAPALAAVGGAGLALASGQALPLLRTPSRWSLLLVWALCLAAAVGWKRLRPRIAPWLAALLLASTALDMAFWSGRWLWPISAAAAFPPSAAVGVLRSTNARFATAPEISASNRAMLDRLYNVTGYEAFYLASIAVYTARSERGPAADGSRTYVRRWHTPEMSRLGVRHYLTREPAPGREPALELGGILLYENPGAKPLVQGGLDWKILAPEHWRLRLAHEPARISQAMYPGWQAWADGRRLNVTVEDGLFPVIHAPHGAGPWTAHFLFRPDAWYAGLALSLASLAMVALAAFCRITEEP